MLSFSCNQRKGGRAALLVVAICAACSGAPTAVSTVGPPTAAPSATPQPAFQLADPPGHVAVDAAGNLYVGLCSYTGTGIDVVLGVGSRIYKVDPSGEVTSLTGQGHAGFAGDDGPAAEAEIACPAGLAVHPDGSLYFSDELNHRVRRVDPQGIITTVAGSGPAYPEEGGFAGDGGPAAAALLQSPSDLTFDGQGNLYVVDQDNYRVRKVDAQGTITTIAGNGAAGCSGNGGPATAATFFSEHSKADGYLAIDATGNIYLSEPGCHDIRRIATDGTITLFAGTGDIGFEGDGGPASEAQMTSPMGLALDANGNLYVVDPNLSTVRKIDSHGIISTVAGRLVSGFAGDGGPATAAQLKMPHELTFDKAGNLYIADLLNFRVRKVDANGTITTVFGGG